MYFEIFKKQINNYPPILVNKKVTYSVNEGPNGAGKTSVSDISTSIASYNIFSDADHFLCQEPPAINLPDLPSDITVRKFLKSGMAGNDPREQLAVFMMSRRKLQLGVHSIKPVLAEGIQMTSMSATSEGRSIFTSDRGMPSSKIYQVRGHQKISPDVAYENSKIIDLAYNIGYLRPYDLTVFIHPSMAKSTNSPEDVFEGKFNETLLYANEICEIGFRCNYSRHNIWVENDTTGSTNFVEEPAVCSAAATIAVFVQRNIDQGIKYNIPLILLDKHNVKIKPNSEIISGNVALNIKANSEAILEINGNLPKVR